MSVFVDKKFENLDWISAATEPMESSINEVLAVLPDCIVVDYPTYLNIVGDSWSLNIDANGVLRHVSNTYKPQNPIEESAMLKMKSMGYSNKSILLDSFKFELEGSPIIDHVNGVISGGQIKLIKTGSTVEEKVLSKILGQEGLGEIYSVYFHPSCGNRVNEIMELLGKCENGIKQKSIKKKRHVLINRLREIFKNNEWSIKDTDLADKMGHWIALYITKGDLSALSNFCRLKVMTHKGNPIYSMEEVS